MGSAASLPPIVEHAHQVRCRRDIGSQLWALVSRGLPESCQRTLRIGEVSATILGFWLLCPDYATLPEPSAVDWHHVFDLHWPTHLERRQLPLAMARVGYRFGEPRGAQPTNVASLDRDVQEFSQEDVGRVGFTYYSQTCREASVLFVIVWVHASGRLFGAILLDNCWPHKDQRRDEVNGQPCPEYALKVKTAYPSRHPPVVVTIGPDERFLPIWKNNDARPSRADRFLCRPQPWRRVFLMASKKWFPLHVRSLSATYDYAIQQIHLFRRSRLPPAKCVPVSYQMSSQDERQNERDWDVFRFSHAPISNLLLESEALIIEQKWAAEVLCPQSIPPH